MIERGRLRRERPHVAAVALMVSLAACGTDAGPSRVQSVEVLPDPVLLVGSGATLTLSVRVVDAGGRQVTDVPVVWTSADTDVVQVGVDSGSLTAVGAGRTRVTATAAGVSGSVGVETYEPEPRTFVVGESFLGREGYVEYIPGDVPVVVSAPHGGSIEPWEIPERTFGVVGQDRRTEETARALVAAIRAASGGGTPHVVINRLHRNRLDANREIVEAAQASVFAERAWSEYHEMIDSAKGRAVAEFGRGLFFDLHGHGHPEQRLELGYLLSAADLNGPDSTLDGKASESSVRQLASESELTFSQLIRGPTSLGALLADGGVRAVPSLGEPGPGPEPYFSGGFNTAKHGSWAGGLVDGIQLELNWTGIRETESDRGFFVAVLAGVLQTYLSEHFGIDWSERP